MPVLVSWLLICSLMLVTCCTKALATVLRVRSEFSTIQAALDSSHENDTVLVATGLYVEALLAPPHFVYLLGDPNSFGVLPEINPTNLPGSDSLACIQLPEGASIVIRNFYFRNGAAMFPRFGLPDIWLSGGIRYANNQSIEITNCIFDSVFAAIRHDNLDSRPELNVEECEFVDCPVDCILCRGKLTLRNSQFRGNLQHAVLCLDSGVIENCQFSGVATTWLRIYGSEQLVRACTFGPGECTRNTIFCNSFGTNRIENCLFQNIGLQGWLIDIPMRHPGTVLLTDNVFRDCYVLDGVNAPIGIGDGGTATNEDSVIITNCRFERMETSSSTTGWAKLFELQNSCGIVSIESNIFLDNPPLTAAVIQADSGRSSFIHNNIFQDNGIGIWNWSQTLDASHNYWGDSTGPYHSTLNPDGLGDEARGNILFEPWYSDSNLLAAPENDTSIPSEAALTVYPNPFNSETLIILHLPFPANVSIKLYDITGRLVQVIWSGTVNGSRELLWRADNLSSGIYFIRADESLNRFSATAKIVLIK